MQKGISPAKHGDDTICDSFYSRQHTAICTPIKKKCP